MYSSHKEMYEGEIKGAVVGQGLDQTYDFSNIHDYNRYGADFCFSVYRNV